MGFGRTFPEIRVTRRGAVVDRVEWVEQPEIEVTSIDSPYREYLPGAEEIVDLTPMHVTSVETKIEPGGPPRVVVTFIARLVEVDGRRA